MKRILLAIAISIIGLPSAWADISADEIDQAAADVQPLVVEWRRVRITVANELSGLLGLPGVKVERGGRGRERRDD